MSHTSLQYLEGESLPVSTLNIRPCPKHPTPCRTRSRGASGCRIWPQSWLSRLKRGFLCRPQCGRAPPSGGKLWGQGVKTHACWLPRLRLRLKWMGTERAKLYQQIELILGWSTRINKSWIQPWKLNAMSCLGWKKQIYTALPTIHTSKSSPFFSFPHCTGVVFPIFCFRHLKKSPPITPSFA